MVPESVARSVALSLAGLGQTTGARGYGHYPLTTLRASLSGTFLQTLPDLVTPLKGTLYLRAAVHRRGQRPPEGLGTDKTVEAT